MNLSTFVDFNVNQRSVPNKIDPRLWVYRTPSDDKEQTLHKSINVDRLAVPSTLGRDIIGLKLATGDDLCSNCGLTLTSYLCWLPISDAEEVGDAKKMFLCCSWRAPSLAQNEK